MLIFTLTSQERMQKIFWFNSIILFIRITKINGRTLAHLSIIQSHALISPPYLPEPQKWIKNKTLLTHINLGPLVSIFQDEQKFLWDLGSKMKSCRVSGGWREDYYDWYGTCPTHLPWVSIFVQSFKFSLPCPDFRHDITSVSAPLQ